MQEREKMSSRHKKEINSKEISYARLNFEIVIDIGIYGWNEDMEKCPKWYKIYKYW